MCQFLREDIITKDIKSDRQSIKNEISNTDQKNSDISQALELWNYININIIWYKSNSSYI